MGHSFAVVVSAPGERWVAYTAGDMDEAEGHRAFLEAELRGARVTIERYEYQEEER